ncbi:MULTISPECIES: hypothetical protein [Streptomyces]|uniref:Uncharacterized protein n=2 Tax=Streptomyces TaxID=1883 RepID=A0A2U9P018_STRAS|nr:hypothetical protein [Streptomyces actuosus]AWT42823.1 hypothetical protein DMT42_11140 [Streptomyces actuosus]MBM4820054.1 hypothetical protein [Streptomyces actuosus]MBM4825064.1 hypothetical protein [Streptomyces actuosus]
MTISLERPAVPVVGVTNLVEPYDEQHAVVTVQMVVSRDQLAAAVEDAATKAYGIQDPDELSVEEVRSLAAFSLAWMSALELEQGAQSMAHMAGPDADDVSLQWYIHAVYRAVDRAFPKAG